jgi:hypothetical protein
LIPQLEQQWKKGRNSHLRTIAIAVLVLREFYKIVLPESCKIQVIRFYYKYLNQTASCF